MAVKENLTEMAELLIHYGIKVNGLGALAMAATPSREQDLINLCRADTCKHGQRWLWMPTSANFAYCGNRATTP